MINCIIVEDELPAREELKYFLNEEKSNEALFRSVNVFFYAITTCGYYG